MKPANRCEAIYPVILSVPEHARQLKGREKVASLSKYARQALEISAYQIGIFLKDLLKDKTGAPLPFDGNYWSLSHKSTCVGGVIAKSPIGIDIEKIRPIAQSLFKKTATAKEWSLSTEDSLRLFFRYWTSKEAVLKATAFGLKDLAKCRVARIEDSQHLVIDYQEKNWLVEHFFFEGHIASVVKATEEIQWILAEKN